MRKLTYIMQVLTALGALASLVAMGLAVMIDDYAKATFNLVLFAVNSGIFYWQKLMRAEL